MSDLPQPKLEPELTAESESELTARLNSKLTSYTFRLLGRRDYSRYELKQKLDARLQLLNKARRMATAEPLAAAACDQLAAEVLDYFYAEGLQSDEKFAEVYLRQAIGSGWGPLKIRQKLRGRGVADNIISSQMTQDDHFWQDQAKDITSRRYSLPFATVAEKAKCYRFLLSRGFTSTQVMGALKSFEQTD